MNLSSSLTPYIQTNCIGSHRPKFKTLKLLKDKVKLLEDNR